MLERCADLLWGRWSSLLSATSSAALSTTPPPTIAHPGICRPAMVTREWSQGGSIEEKAEAAERGAEAAGAALLLLLPLCPPLDAIVCILLPTRRLLECVERLIHGQRGRRSRGVQAAG